MNHLETVILEIIKSINKQPNVNPTEIYNEGWMTRLLVYYSIKQKLKLKKINFSMINNWTSEALISSPFIRAKKYREGYTHADMSLGDFTVNYIKDGKIDVPETAKTFGIIEAKMKSSLSTGTTHAPTYDQASRNVACIACNTNKDCDIFFYVVAPESQLTKVHRNGKSMIDIVEKEKIKDQINLRFKLHNKNNAPIEKENQIKEQVAYCDIDIITYEDWIKKFNGTKRHKLVSEFYEKCKLWNRIE